MGAVASQVDTDRDRIADFGVVAIDQPLAFMQRYERFGVERRMAAAEADLRETRALTDQHREGTRADLGIERSVIARRHLVEAARLIGDHAREHIEPAGRAFRVGGGGDPGRQREAFDQRHDIDAAGLQHRSVAEHEFVQLEVVDPLRDGGARAGQKTRAHAKRDFAEPQVETRGLDLLRNEVIGLDDGAVFGERRDHAVRQDARVSHSLSSI